MEENKQTKEYKIKDKYMSQDNIINDSLEYNDLDNTSDIQGVLQRWYNKQ